MKVAEILTMLEKDGWKLVRTRGSHRHFRHILQGWYRNCRWQAEPRLGAWHPEQHLEASRAQVDRRTSMRYAVVVEKAAHNYSAYVPDLPGCVAAAETEEAVLKLIREAIDLHLESLREEGDPVPEPTSHAAYVEV
jgi:predicted RNase H-like HicB family nuclease